MKAQIGLLVEGQMGLNWSRWDQILSMAQRAGYQNVFCSDHFVDPEPPDQDSLEVWTALTYAATKTTSIEIGPLVSPITFRSPTLLARQAAAVDDLSGGRLVFGLGAGWQHREHENYAIPFYDQKTRFERLTDALEITQRLFDNTQPVTFEGNHLRVKDAILLPRPKRRTPILIGGNGPKRTLPLAARFADEWNAVYIDADEFATKNLHLSTLIAAIGREQTAVKRSLMLPFKWVEGAKGSDVLSAYVEGGCERFMIQITEYDNLDPIEDWAGQHLLTFS